jgi:hypothetical protein
MTPPTIAPVESSSESDCMSVVGAIATAVFDSVDSDDADSDDGVNVGVVVVSDADGGNTVESIVSDGDNDVCDNDVCVVFVICELIALQLLMFPRMPKPWSHWHTFSVTHKPWPLQLFTALQSAKQSAPEKPALHVHLFASMHLPPQTPRCS